VDAEHARLDPQIDVLGNKRDFPIAEPGLQRERGAQDGVVDPAAGQGRGQGFRVVPRLQEQPALRGAAAVV
jgi:hypothetical protein